METYYGSLTQDYLRQMFIYDPETGILTNRVTRGKARAGNPVGHFDRNRGYLAATVAKKVCLVHRLIWLYVHGYWPERIDHIDGDKLNNRLSNLRNCDAAENARNAKLSKNNTSGILGVRYCTERNKWVATIMVNRKTVHLGRFNRKEEAIAARQAANRKYGFSERHGTGFCL